MTVDEVKMKVQEIAAIGLGDPEMAHSNEDELYRMVLRAIADGTCEDPRALAAEVLKAKDLDFPRWCA